MRIELRAQSFRDARHHIERGRAAHIDPVPELLDAHLALALRHAEASERVREQHARKADQRRLLWRDVTLERGLLDWCGVEQRHERLSMPTLHKIRPS